MPTFPRVSLLLFSCTLFLSATLLFVVQPMAGKRLLPLVGGTPAVWTTCLLFFQCLLLFGYVYVDRLGRLPLRWQIVTQSVVAGLGLTSLVLLQPDDSWIPEDQDYPVAALGAYLFVLIGVPFFALSATAPLLQSWFTQCGHQAGQDPYFLYAASNAGSLVGLLGYPFLVEPWWTLPEQQSGWNAGYIVWLLGLCCCAAYALSRFMVRQATVAVAEFATSAEISPDSASNTEHEPPEKLTPRQFIRWMIMSAVPSCFLLSATTHFTTDIAPVPLLWVVPLSLYLLSYIIVFTRWSERARRELARLVPMLLIFLSLAMLIQATEPVLLISTLHLGTLFAVGLLCHGELAADRPHPVLLTRFYLALSLGGVAGGFFNAILAPLLFATLGPVEYPLLIAAVGLIRPQIGGRLVPLRLSLRDLLIITAYASFVLVTVTWIPKWLPVSPEADAADQLFRRWLRSGLMFGIPAVLVYLSVRNPARFSSCLAVLFLIAGIIAPGPRGETLLIRRNFFGTLRVTRSADDRFIQLVHGTTTHGQEPVAYADCPLPSTYYHPTGPIGRLLEQLPSGRRHSVGVVGLGIGSLAAYARPGESWTFFEIDPNVVRIARDSGYFHFLQRCSTQPEIVLGDARRQLERQPDSSYDLLVLDAFSSDAIPVHLLTREAFALYARKLKRHGLMVFHLSNRYLDLPPLVARLGAEAEPPWLMKLDEDFATEMQQRDGKYASTWGVLARSAEDFRPAAMDAHWQLLRARPGVIWTDAFSNVLSVWKRPGE